MNGSSTIGESEQTAMMKNARHVCAMCFEKRWEKASTVGPHQRIHHK